MAEKEETTESKHSELLKTAQARFKLAEDAFSTARELAKEDLEFKAGIQWDPQLRATREAQKRPCLTVNRIPQQTRQITNDQRQNRPSIKILPVDDGADLETAKVFQGIIRHIEYQSNAESAYDHAFEGAVDGGFGFFRIVTDYVSPKSFLQEARFKRIADHFSVLFDPYSREPDGSDANWAFVFEDVPVDDFKARYPNAEISKEGNWELSIKDTPDWVTEDSCRVAEYFYKDFKTEEIVSWQSNDAEGSSGVSTREEFEALKEANPGFIFTEIAKRKTETAVVKWAKICGTDVLEETEFPSQWIPIIPVYGSEALIDGKRVYEGVIRHAKDPQRAYNFWNTAAAEAIALAPKAPFIAEEGQIEGYEEIWKNANNTPLAVLPYKGRVLENHLVGPPQRNTYEPPVQAIMAAQAQSSEDIKATTGIYDAALGNRSNENSGIAIQRRANQAQTSNYHFVDNLNLSMKHAGRILLEIIPVVYDTERAQQIIGEDGQAEVIFINREFERNGKPVTYDLSKGKYDVVCEVGPGYATQRQEAVASMLEFITVYPAAAQVLGDLIAKNQDWPGSQEIAERLRKLIPPHILGDEGGEIPPQAQAQIAQMTQMIQMLQSQLQAATFELETKNAQKHAELASKERIALMDNETELQKEAMKIPVPGAFEALFQQMAEINQRLQMVGVNVPMITPQQQIPQDFSGAGPMGQPPFQVTPTGGQPGQPMGVMP